MAAKKNYGEDTGKRGAPHWTLKKIYSIYKFILKHLDDNPGVVSYKKQLYDKYKTTPENLTNVINRRGWKQDPTILDLKRQIKNVTEERLIDNSLTNKWNAGFARFLLSCNHDYVVKTEQEIKITENNISFKFDMLNDKSNDNDIDENNEQEDTNI